MALPFYILTSNVREFLLVHILTNTAVILKVSRRSIHTHWFADSRVTSFEKITNPSTICIWTYMPDTIDRDKMYHREKVPREKRSMSQGTRLRNGARGDWLSWDCEVMRTEWSCFCFAGLRHMHGGESCYIPEAWNTWNVQAALLRVFFCPSITQKLCCSSHFIRW